MHYISCILLKINLWSRFLLTRRCLMQLQPQPEVWHRAEETESPAPGGIDDPIFDIRKSIHRCSFNMQLSSSLWACLETKKNWISSVNPRSYKWFLTPGGCTGGRKVLDRNRRCLLISNKPNTDKRAMFLINKCLIRIKEAFWFQTNRDGVDLMYLIAIKDAFSIQTTRMRIKGRYLSWTSRYNNDHWGPGTCDQR